jgi:hypothetical protein
MSMWSGMGKWHLVAWGGPPSRADSQGVAMQRPPGAGNYLTMMNGTLGGGHPTTTADEDSSRRHATFLLKKRRHFKTGRESSVT